MKILQKSFLGLIVSGLIGYSGVFAAGIDHFEVILQPESAKVGEALDLSIQAVDKNNNIVTDYNGTILIFSESDPEAELPSALEDNSYVFIASDQGEIKFENSVKFKSSGTHDIHIYDLDDDTVLGVAEAAITEDASETSIDIEIISPESGLTIGENSVNVSGATRKNHKVVILVNGIESSTTTSNNDGIFEKQIDNLDNGETLITTQVLNSDNEVVGESSEVKIKVEANLPQLKNIKVTPAEVDVESSFEVELIASKGLIVSNVIINDRVTKLEEKTEGVYRANIYSPKEAGVYKVDVVMQDELGHEVKELGAESLTVKKVELAVADDETQEDTSAETTQEEPLESAEEETKDLNITGIKVTKLKSKSVVTWDEVKDVDGYNVYKKSDDDSLELIESVKEPRFEIDITGTEIQHDFFAIKAMAKTASGEIYEGNLSEATEVQTGPEILILLILSLFIGGFLFVSTNKKRA